MVTYQDASKTTKGDFLQALNNAGIVYLAFDQICQSNSQRVAQQTWKCILLDVVPENFIRAMLKSNIKHYDSSKWLKEQVTPEVCRK